MLGLLLGLSALCAFVTIGNLFQLWSIHKNIQLVENHLHLIACKLSNEVRLQDTKGGSLGTH
jgi:hypothetical protein